MNTQRQIKRQFNNRVKANRERDERNPDREYKKKTIANIKKDDCFDSCPKNRRRFLSLSTDGSKFFYQLLFFIFIFSNIFFD